MNLCQKLRPVTSFVIAAFLALPLVAAGQAPAILHAAEAGKLLPDAVFFAGQSATTQLRNSAGLRFADGRCVLAVLVDTSGYSSTVQQKYQGYLLSEVPLSMGGHSLAPGAYGIGFVGGRFFVMDIGNHNLLQAPAAHDAQMPRPMPLQILGNTAPGADRLCFGRDCVDLRRER